MAKRDGVHGLVVLALVVCSSCALVVDPAAGGDRCVLAVSKSECATCASQRCASEIDSCCLRGSCGDVVNVLEQCARANDGTCNDMRTRATASDPAEAAVASCVQRECAGYCSERIGTSKTECRESRTGESTCTCVTGGTPTELECSETTFPETRCCATPGWPAQGLVCTCAPFLCRPSGTGCFCSINEFDTGITQTSCGGAGLRCCRFNTTCTCSATDEPCLAPEEPVERCSIDVVGCPSDQVRVSSCSVRE